MGKSQITVYFIIGFFAVLVLAFLLFYLNAKTTDLLKPDQNNAALEIQSQQVEKYLQQCMHYAGIRETYLIGLQGGYLELGSSMQFEQAGFVKIPYWYHSHTDFAPSLESMEQQLSSQMKTEVTKCFSSPDLDDVLHGSELDLSDFQGSNNSIISNINQDDVTFTLNSPLLLKKDISTVKIENIQDTIPLSLGRIYNLSRTIHEKILQSEKFNIKDICGIVNETGYVNVYSFNNRVIINDYLPFYQKLQTFTFQFIYENKSVYGYCA